MKKIIFTILAIVILCLVWEAYHLYNKPHESVATETASNSINAVALYQQYQQNEHVADSLYLGKIIEVKGILSSIDTSSTTAILELSQQKDGGGISCQMFAQDKNASAYPAIGSNITVKGKCTGFLMDVSLVDCVTE